MAVIDNTRRNVHRLLSERDRTIGELHAGLSAPQRRHLETVLGEYLSTGEVEALTDVFAWRGAPFEGEVRPFGSGNPNSYLAVHHRLRRERGAARSHVCECGQAASTWAYLGGDPDELFGETKSGRGDRRAYSTDLGRYEPRCYSCHSRMDKARSRAAGGERHG